MDGNVCPLPQIKRLAEQYDALIFIDECHATGFFGATGRGETRSVSQLLLTNHNPLYINQPITAQYLKALTNHSTVSVTLIVVKVLRSSMGWREVLTSSTLLWARLWEELLVDILQVKNVHLMLSLQAQV